VPSANIIISQAGDSGQAGRSRDDLDVGLTVTLTNADNVGVYSYRWSMVDQPAESEAVLSGINSPACTFVPDEPGTYRIKLSINEGNLAGQTQYRLCAIRNSNGTRYFAYGEKGEEVNWDVDGEENTRGRTPDNDLWLSLIPESAGSYIEVSGHAARSVVGRSANSSGNAADIAGAGARSVLVDSGTALGFRTLTTDDVLPGTLYDQDFSLLASQDWVAGGDNDYDINGLEWRVGNTTAATAFGIITGQGVVFDANATNGTYSSTTRTAPFMRVGLGNVFGDLFGTYLIEAYFSSLTLGVSNNRVLVAVDLDTAGTDRLLGGGRRNSSGTQQTYATIDSAATIVGNTATHTNIGFVYEEAGGVLQAADSFSSVMSPAANLVISFITGETGAAMAATLRRLRVRRIY
jgi:hypothetical protein